MYRINFYQEKAQQGVKVRKEVLRATLHRLHDVPPGLQSLRCLFGQTCSRPQQQHID